VKDNSEKKGSTQVLGDSTLRHRGRWQEQSIRCQGEVVFGAVATGGEEKSPFNGKERISPFNTEGMRGKIPFTCMKTSRKHTFIEEVEAYERGI